MAKSARDAEEEDQVMAEWLSNPEDDNEVDGIDWATGNVPVEGKKEDFDELLEQADDEGNQPNLQPTEPEPDEQLLLAQPEEQGECSGKAASKGSGEGVDKANEAIQASVTTKNGRHKV